MAVRRPFNSPGVPRDLSAGIQTANEMDLLASGQYGRKKRQKTTNRSHQSTSIDEIPRCESIASTCVAPEVVVPLRYPSPHCGWGEMSRFEDIESWEPAEANMPSSSSGDGNTYDARFCHQGHPQLPSPPLPSYQDNAQDQDSNGHLGPDEKVDTDSDISMTGSWCDLKSTEPALEVPYPPLSHDWYPQTPDDSRLSTPDLAPMSTHYQFCPCCSADVQDQDRINKMWYIGSKARVEQQVADAMVYINMTRAGGVSKTGRSLSKE